MQDEKMENTLLGTDVGYKYFSNAWISAIKIFINYAWNEPK